MNDEATYNNVSQALTALNNKLFLKSHISHYTEQDVDIFDAYPTKPICGNVGALAKSASKKLVVVLRGSRGVQRCAQFSWESRGVQRCAQLESTIAFDYVWALRS